MFFRSPRRSLSSSTKVNFLPPYMSPRQETPQSSTRPPVTLLSTQPGLQPYLGLRARTSLAWLAYPILILVLILIQLILTLESVGDSVGDAKREIAAACSGVEGAASVAVSIPHFMADQTNDLLVSGAENIVHGLAVVLDLSIKAIEAIILYVIDTYRSLYLCLAEFVVKGSLALLIAVAEEAEKVFSEAVRGVRTAIQSTIGAAESTLNGAINDLNKLPLVHITPPSLTVPELPALQNFKMPTGLSDALTKLNSSLPTLADLRDSLDKLVATPFEAMRTDVTAKLGNATIDRSLLKVPPQKRVEFCQDLDTSFIDTIGKIISTGIKIIIVVIISAIILIALFNVLKERLFWGRMISNLHRSRDTWLDTNDSHFLTPKLLSFLQSMKNPLISGASNKLCQKDKSGRHRKPWLLAYLTWPGALLFLGAGLLGLIVVEVQMSALHGLRIRAVDEANSGVDGFTNLLTDKINQETLNMSASYANNTNTVILHFQSDINDHMLGWAGTTSTTLNNTLVSFYNGLTTVVNDTFGNTPLRDPALELLRCLIGSKVAGIEAALTFVHDHARVDLPTVSPTVLMIKPRQTQELVSSMAPDNGNMPQDSKDPNNTLATSFVDRMIDRYSKALNKQRITYLALLACYLIVIIFGTIGILWDVFQEKRTSRNSGPPERPREREPEAGMSNNDKPKYREATESYLPYPYPPSTSFAVLTMPHAPRHPPPPPPPSFLELGDDSQDQPISKFSPVTPALSPKRKWSDSRSKK